MDEYLIVPKHVMDQKLTDIRISKEPLSSSDAVDLHCLTDQVLKRKDISVWQKADALTASLQKFLSMRPGSERAEQAKAAAALPSNPVVLTREVDDDPIASDHGELPLSTNKPSSRFRTNPTPSQRGVKRKRAPEATSRKRIAVAALDELMSDVEEERPSPRGTKRQVEEVESFEKRPRREPNRKREDLVRKRMKQSTNLKRKISDEDDGKPSKKRKETVNLKRKLQDEDRPAQKKTKPTISLKRPAERGFSPEPKRIHSFKSIVPRGVKRKITEIDAGPSILRNKIQRGSGQQWIQLY